MRKAKKERPRRSTPAAPSASRSRDWSGLLAAMVLVLAALALYSGSLRNPLVFDDLPLARPGALTASAELLPPRLRWLTQLSFGWIGSDWYWQRLLNVVLHAASAAALFGFLARLFGVLLGEQGARWYAFYAAILFLLHPVAVYGVAYLVERSIVMATLFSLLSLRCVLEGWLRPSVPWLLAAAGSYVLAVLSKEHAIMLPAVALALVLLLRPSPGVSARRLALPAAAFALIAVAVLYAARANIGATYEPYATDAFGYLLGREAGFNWQEAYPLSVINQGWLFFQYLLVWAVPWPGWMSIDLRMPFPSQLLVWPQAAGFVAWLAYPVGAAVLLRRGGRAGVAGFGLLAPWLLALTEMSVTRLQEPFVLYRSYLWMPLLFAVLPAVLGRIPLPWRHGLVAVACGALIGAALDRLGSFGSSYKVWDDVVRSNKDSRAPLVERGYMNRGMLRWSLGQLPEALADFEQALALNQRYPDAWLGRASLHLNSGRPAEAIADLDRALALDPRYASAWDKRCVALLTLGRAEEARRDCDRAVAFDPRNLDAWVDRGAAYYRLGLNTAAEESYRQALALDPAHAVANHNLGVLLIDTGRRDLAVRQHFVTACNGGLKAACNLLKRSRVE